MFEKNFKLMDKLIIISFWSEFYRSLTQLNYTKNDSTEIINEQILSLENFYSDLDFVENT